MSISVYTDEDLRHLLRQRVAQKGSQRAWARTHGIDYSYLSRVLGQQRPVGKLLARVLGYRVTGGPTYLPLDDNPFFNL